jgi:hypothetical protein
MTIKSIITMVGQHIFIVLSVLLLGVPWVLQFCTDARPPQLFHMVYGDWITVPVFYWVSMGLLCIGICYKMVKKEKPYRFRDVLVLFFIQVFLGFNLLTPYPLILIVVFSVVYKLIVERKGRQA